MAECSNADPGGDAVDPSGSSGVHAGNGRHRWNPSRSIHGATIEPLANGARSGGSASGGGKSSSNDHPVGSPKYINQWQDDHPS